MSRFYQSINARFCSKCGLVMQEVASDDDTLYAAKFERPDRCGCGHFERVTHLPAYYEEQLETYIAEIMRTVDGVLPKPKYTH